MRVCLQRLRLGIAMITVEHREEELPDVQPTEEELSTFLMLDLMVILIPFVVWSDNVR